METILLDRCVVVEIEKFNNNMLSVPYKTIEKVRKKDKKSIFVSPLLSIIEAAEGRQPNATEISDAIDRETKVVRSFFRNSRTDSIYLNSHALELCINFAKEADYQVKKSSNFILELKKLFKNTTGKNESESIIESVLVIAKNEGHSPGHPITLCGISCALGYEHGRRILKPKETSNESIFNVVMDFNKISNLSYIKHLASNSGQQSKIDFFTFDTPLKNFFSIFKINESKSELFRGYGLDYVFYSINENAFMNAMPFLIGHPKKKEKIIEMVFRRPMP